MEKHYRLWTAITLILMSGSGLAMGWLCDWLVGWQFPVFRLLGVFAGFFFGCLIRNVPEEGYAAQQEALTLADCASRVAPNELENPLCGTCPNNGDCDPECDMDGSRYHAPVTEKDLHEDFLESERLAQEPVDLKDIKF